MPYPDAGTASLPLLAMREFHREAVGDFLDPDTFGLVQDRDHVAGFVPHAFREAHVLGASGAGLKLERLDLVSLRKPAGPHAYLSANYPRVDELKRADTRLPHDFETRALARLRTDDDVVIEEVEGSVRMLGALRAGSHCLGCHTARRGELIGALSYEFLRKTPETERKEPSPLIAQQ